MANSGNYRGDNNDTKITGDTDDTNIGNTGDRLKVDAQLSFSGTSTLPRISTKLRYDDMNASTGGVARDTNITSASGYNSVYDYSGSGVLIGFGLTLEEAEKWNIRLTVDSEVIFDIDTGDLEDDQLYGYKYGDKLPEKLGICTSNKTFYFQSPQGTAIDYATNVTVEVDRSSGGNKKFRAGFVTLTKET